MLKLIPKTLILSCIALMALAQPLSIASAQIISSRTMAANDTARLTCVDLISDLDVNSTDEIGGTGTVRKLQEFLYPQYLSVAATGYFGPQTKAAVIKFQTASNITPAAGYVGAITRAKIKAISCGGMKSASTAIEPYSAGGTSANTVAAYNSNNTGWWLSPVTTPTTSTKPGSTGVSNNPVTTTISTNSTTTPPANCGQYSGVIPGDSRKVSVVQKSFLNFTVPGVDQAGLNKISQDLAGPMRMTVNPTGPHLFPPGTAYAYKFTTGEYNVPTVWRDAGFGGTVTGLPNGGVMLMSVSRCPGDFTSPSVLRRESGYNGSASCVAAIPPLHLSSGHLNFGINVGQYACELTTNTEYYLNFTPGFEKENGDPFGSSPYTIMAGADGTFGGMGGSVHLMQGSVDLRPDSLGFFGYRTSTGGASLPVVKVLKGVDETYEAVHRAMSAWNSNAYNAMQSHIARIRACVASGNPRNGCNFPFTTPPTLGRWQ